MLLQVLGALECLAAETTLVWLEGDVDSNMGGDVVALDRAGVASLPATDEVQVVGALSSNVPLTEVVLSRIKLVAAHLGQWSTRRTKRLSAESARSPHCFHLQSRVSSVLGAAGIVVLFTAGWPLLG